MLSLAIAEAAELTLSPFVDSGADANSAGVLAPVDLPEAEALAAFSANRFCLEAEGAIVLLSKSFG